VVGPGSRFGHGGEEKNSQDDDDGSGCGDDDVFLNLIDKVIIIQSNSFYHSSETVELSVAVGFSHVFI
jgi:hypothetical protein